MILYLIFIFVDYAFLILIWFDSKYSFRYVLSTIRNSSGEDFEKNNFTKLGKITGLGRRNKISLERKFCNIYTIEDRRRKDCRKSGAPSPSRNKSRVGFRKISVEQTAFKGLVEVFSPRFVFYFHLLPQRHLSLPLPPLSLFLEPPTGPRYFPFSIHLLLFPLLFSSPPFWPFTDNVTITSQCSGNRGHLSLSLSKNQKTPCKPPLCKE